MFLEVSFQGQHSKLWTLSKLVYTFTTRYSLARRAFLRRNLCGALRIPGGFKIAFFPMENLFFSFHFH